MQTLAHALQCDEVLNLYNSWPAPRNLEFFSSYCSQGLQFSSFDLT